MFPYDPFPFLIKERNLGTLLILNVTDMLSPEQTTSRQWYIVYHDTVELQSWEII